VGCLGESNMTQYVNDKEYYKKQLEKANEYQDYVVVQLHKYTGLTIPVFSSYKYQLNVGESLCGFEIKHDENLKYTGNLFIETQERRSINNPYVSSGIYRDDNSWIYIIGDYKKIFIFAKNHLRFLHEKRKYRLIENKYKTARGFLLPSKYAEDFLAIKTVNILQVTT
jgi:hypothetical protein